MAGTTVRYVSSETEIDAIRVGSIIREIAPTRLLRGQASSTIGLVIGDAEQGAFQSLVDIDRAEELLAEFYPFAPGAYGGFESLTGLPFAKLKAIRVTASADRLAASVTLLDATSGNSVDIEAISIGPGGNRVRVDITANASDATARDLRVYVPAPDGTIVYDESYPAFQNSSGVVSTVDDDLVTVTAASGATAAAAAITGAALTGGTNGTLTDAEYTAAFQQFLGPGVKVAAVVAVGVNPTLVDAVNTAMATVAAQDGAENRSWIGATEGGLSKADVITDVADWRDAAGRVVTMWPKLQRRWRYSRNGYDVSGTSDLCGAPIYACALLYTDPGGAVMMNNPERLKRLTQSVVGLESAYVNTTLSQYDDLATAGIAAWFDHAEFGITVYEDVSTLLVSSLPYAAEDRRYKDYILGGIAPFNEGILGKALDLDLANSRLGTNTGAVIRGWRGFLDAENRAGRITAGRNPGDIDTVSPAYSIDPFTQADPAQVAQGRWNIGLQIRKTPTAKRVVVYAEIETYITINVAV